MMIDEITKLLQEMIRNRCINPPGGEMRNIRTVDKFLNSYGIQTEIFESDSERGNLFAEILGSSEHPSLMLGPAHVDVVPVESEENWAVPPFEGEIRDEFVWGRGALDMLYIVACQSATFAKLHQEGFKPKGTLKLLIVADEEAGGEYGANWMVRNYPEKMKVDYLITEFGGEPIAANRIGYTYGEKGVAWTRMHFEGFGQHGSAPYKANNAIIKLSDAVKKIIEYRIPKSTELIKPILKALGVGGITGKLLSRPSTLPFMLNQVAKRNEDLAKYIHALTQMTWSPNVCRGGEKANIIPENAYLDIDIRLLPGQDEKYIDEQLTRALGNLADEVKFERLVKDKDGKIIQGSASETKSPLVSIIEDVVRELKGDEYRLVPLFSVGATDCRFFRKAFGTQAYGFSIFDDTFTMAELIKLLHARDERISLGTLELTYNGYLEIVKRFLS